MPQIDFIKIEEKILKFWEKNKIFNKTLKKPSPNGDFVFYEGPPTANGRPHIGHVLTRVYKDVVLRYKTMRGFFVKRKAGWDTQGLPVELEVEKEIGISGKPEIEKYGVDKFNKQCEKSVWKYKDEWEKITQRTGFWLDLKDPYITYKKEYIETLWWIIKKTWNKGLLYQDYKVVPHCSRCGTTLSSHEVAQGYKNIKEDSIYLKFELKDLNLKKPTYFYVWTTTPWTLPGNTGLAINKNVYYVKVLKNNEYWILAKDRLCVLERPYEIVDEFLGKKLLGMKYKPIFEFITPKKFAWFVIHGDFVSTEDGTGIVHIAPAFGEDDMMVGKENDLPILMTVESNGTVSPQIGEWGGKWVKHADPLIVKFLKNKGVIVKVEEFAHDYPFCWRCDTPLIYYAKLSWFIKMSDKNTKDCLIKNSELINWVPKHIKQGRFGEWIKGVKDWAISRERYWGTPLPIWECKKCNYKECIGSYDELAKKTDKKILKSFDPHRPLIDKWTWKCPKCDGLMKRVDEVLDCWFDSGGMPFAQNPGFWKNIPEKELETNISNIIPFPADFICEALDQTRGWFYSLLAISTLLDYGPSYKNVVCLGLVLDSQGQKMSKSKGNVVDPWEIINNYGADVFRWYFYTVNQPGESKTFNIDDLKKVTQKVFLTLYNVFEYYKMYAKNVSKKEQVFNVSHVLDKWILLKLNALIKQVSKRMDKYDITGAGREIEAFILDLSQWYLRRSRDRFKTSDIKEASQTLYYVLLTTVKLLSPFTPFLSENLYLDLTLKKNKQSVHLEDWPKYNKDLYDEKLLNQMQTTRKICELAHNLRMQAKIRVRQPLSKLAVMCKPLSQDFVNIIKQEINVENIEFVKTLPSDNNWFVNKESEIRLGLNTQITHELKIQGLIREFIRHINSLRKQAGLTKKDLVSVYYQTNSSQLRNVLNENKDIIKEQTVSKDVIEKQGVDVLEKKQVKIDEQEVVLFLLK